MPRRTVGPFRAINGKRPGLLELARQLFEPGEHLAAAGPSPWVFVASRRLRARTGSLIGCSYRPPCSGCCWQCASLLGGDYCVWPTLKMVWTEVHKLSWKGATGLVCKHARSGRLLAEQSWLSACPSRCSPPACLRQPRLHNPSLCSWVRRIDFPGRPARLESLWPVSPPCLFALKTAEVVIKMNKGFQAELSAEA